MSAERGDVLEAFSRIGLRALAAAILAGCSGIKIYPDTLPQNVRVRTETSSNVRAALHVHRVDANCLTEYLGTVQLNTPSIGLGIPAGRLSLVAVTFSSSSFLGGSSQVRVETLLRPHAGYTYDAKVRYADSMYEVVILEIDSRKSSSREVERKGLRTCVPS